MTKLIVDGIEVDVPPHFTLLQAVEAAGAEVPRFCYHERLSVAGNCRMCLVELKGAPKPVASCAYAVRECRPGPNGEPPVINTRTASVKKAREGVMEFLLINHPLDCPICDQGGECDLQDQAMAYGVDNSRYVENKRAVEDKNIGPLVKTTMTRCIHCTRCVRFTQEVAGVGDLGAIGRGEDMEITTYLEAAMASEMQGNVVDLCPVGALTSKPYQNRSRPWELSKTESIDVMDAVGSNIRIDARGKEVLRILPRVNEAINEEWISDKTRHVVDGLKTQRLDRPYIRENGKLRPASWNEAFAAIASRLKTTTPDRIGAIGGALAAVEDLFALKALINALGSQNTDMQGRGGLDPAKGRASYIFNSTIEGIDAADAIMIIGSNPRREAPVLNSRILRRSVRGGLLTGVIGVKSELTYAYNYLGAGPEALSVFTDHAPAQKDKPMFIIGEGAFNRPDGAQVIAMAAKAAQAIGVIKDGWNGFNVLHSAASMVGALDINFVPGEGGKTLSDMVSGGVDVLFNLGADEISIPVGAFVIYQGTHGDRGAQRADVILPGAAYTEKSATYVNMEGRPQMTSRAVFPPGEAKEDWSIVRALSEVLAVKLSFDSLQQLRAALYAAHPHLASIGSITTADPASISKLAKGSTKTSKTVFSETVPDFYLTNPIARSSAVMAECSALFKNKTAGAALAIAAE
jgi:NADH-quinone oxidoreductase subunit G